MKNYHELKQWRSQQWPSVSSHHEQLNEHHDELIKEILSIAVERVKSEWGPPPAHFAFFIMGSGGRFEQSVWSDQDHGIIYDGTEESKEYFLHLGLEITNGLSIAGYERCDGNVMASNALWCNSVENWQIQIEDWLAEESLDSLRYFSTFFDSRVLFGEKKYLLKLKQTAFVKLEEEPDLYLRLLENVRYVKKAIGPFGQLLPEQYGEETGHIDLKKTVLFPYVNSLRLLALKERITSPSTLSRFQQLPSIYDHIRLYQPDFIKLLNFRLHFRKDAPNYEKVHLLNIELLTKAEKQELKQLTKRGYKLFSETKGMIEKGCST